MALMIAVLTAAILCRAQPATNHLPAPMNWSAEQEHRNMTGNYLTDPMLPINTALTNGELAWRQHDGGHTDAPIWPTFLKWADRYTHGPPLARQSAAKTQ